MALYQPLSMILCQPPLGMALSQHDTLWWVWQLTWLRTLARAGRLADAVAVYEEAKLGSCQWHGSNGTGTNKFNKSVPLHNTMLNALAGASALLLTFE